MKITPEMKQEQKWFESKMERKGTNEFSEGRNGKGDGERFTRSEAWRDKYDQIKGFGKNKVNVIGTPDLDPND